MAEDQKKRAVGDLLSEINRQQQQALEMDACIRQEGEILKQRHARGDVDPSYIGHYQSYVSQMRRAIATRIDKVTEIQKGLHAARRELAEARKQTRILEKLKERRYTRYQRALNKAEALQTDEISTQMFLRKKRHEAS